MPLQPGGQQQGVKREATKPSASEFTVFPHLCSLPRLVLREKGQPPHAHVSPPPSLSLLGSYTGCRPELLTASDSMWETKSAGLCAECALQAAAWGWRRVHMSTLSSRARGREAHLTSREGSCRWRSWRAAPAFPDGTSAGHTPLAGCPAPLGCCPVRTSGGTQPRAECGLCSGGLWAGMLIVWSGALGQISWGC